MAGDVKMGQSSRAWPKLDQLIFLMCQAGLVRSFTQLMTGPTHDFKLVTQSGIWASVKLIYFLFKLLK